MSHTSSSETLQTAPSLPGVEIIARIRPDILVKGGDYDMAKLPETKLVESWGGHALALPFVAGYSTTKLVQRIRAS